MRLLAAITLIEINRSNLYSDQGSTAFDRFIKLIHFNRRSILSISSRSNKPRHCEAKISKLRIFQRTVIRRQLQNDNAISKSEYTGRLCDRFYKERFLALQPRLRPYHVEYTPSRPIWEVKQRRARLVLGWVTAWEYRVL